MAHDGQTMPQSTQDAALLPDLLALTRAAVAPVEQVLDLAVTAVRGRVTEDGKVSAAALDREQTAAHGLAWLATYAQALRQMQAWAERLEAAGRFGELEALILQIGFGEYLWQVYGGIPMNQGEIVRMQDLGLGQEDQRVLMSEAAATLANSGNTQAARSRLTALMQEQSANVTVGASGLDDEMEMIRDQFRRFTVDQVAPHAHDWHLKDELIPMEIIVEMAEMGVFGLTIPEEYRRVRAFARRRCAWSPRSCRAAISASARSAPARRSRPS